MMSPSYSTKYFDWQKEGSKKSASVVIPKIIELISPKSVLDLGCGTGTWLAVFKELGVSDFVGIDGAYISPEMLEIPRETFLPFDLAKDVSLNRKFDLVISLEVAEHLPDSSSQIFVNSLTKHADKVVFSAAIPFQGGPNHVNEQWPYYWAKLFRNNNFVALDPFRSDLWNDQEIEWWYRQNLLLFVNNDVLPACKNLEQYICKDDPLSLVHPRCFEDTVAVCEKVIREKRYSDGANF